MSPTSEQVKTRSACGDKSLLRLHEHHSFAEVSAETQLGGKTAAHGRSQANRPGDQNPAWDHGTRSQAEGEASICIVARTKKVAKASE